MFAKIKSKQSVATRNLVTRVNIRAFNIEDQASFIFDTIFFYIKGFIKRNSSLLFYL